MKRKKFNKKNRLKSLKKKARGTYPWFLYFFLIFGLFFMGYLF